MLLCPAFKCGLWASNQVFLLGGQALYQLSVSLAPCWFLTSFPQSKRKENRKGGERKVEHRLFVMTSRGQVRVPVSIRKLDGCLQVSHFSLPD